MRSSARGLQFMMLANLTSFTFGRTTGTETEMAYLRGGRKATLSSDRREKAESSCSSQNSEDLHGGMRLGVKLETEVHR